MSGVTKKLKYMGGSYRNFMWGPIGISWGGSYRNFTGGSYRNFTGGPILWPRTSRTSTTNDEEKSLLELKFSLIIVVANSRKM